MPLNLQHLLGHHREKGLESFKEEKQINRKAESGEVMSVLDKLASRQGVKSDVPNQELARELVLNNFTDGINEIAENLSYNEKAVQSDCVKVLYEIGYLNP